MDPLSAAASIVTLLDVACKSTKYIITLMKCIVHGPPDIQRHRAYVHALLGTLLELQLICNNVHLRQAHKQRLLSNVKECVADIRELEKRILKVDYNLTSAGKLQGIWALAKLAKSHGRPYPDKIFDRILIWNTILISDLLVIEMNSHIELKTIGLRSDTTIQSLQPLMARINDQLSNPKPKQRNADQQHSSQQLISGKFKYFLQTALSPKAISGKYLYRFEIPNIMVILRAGPVIIQKWATDGKETYQTLNVRNGYGIDITIQAPCLFHARISLMLFFMAKIFDCWTVSASSRIMSQKIVSENARAVQAAGDGDTIALMQLFSNKQAGPTDTLLNGQNLLHIAASKNRLTVVKLLLEQGALVNATTDCGDTALHLAVRYRADYELARILIENGADLESLNTHKQTPLHDFFSPMVPILAQRHNFSAGNRSEDARGMNLAHYFSWTNSSTPSDFQMLSQVDALLEVSDAVGRTALHLAAQRGNISVMRYLLSKGVALGRSQTDNQGNTPVHEAVLSPRAPLAIELLVSYGFTIDTLNRKNHAPLQHAAMWGTVPALSFLLRSNPAGIAWRDARGRGLLTLARQTENRQVTAWLRREYGDVEAGGKTQVKRINIDWTQRNIKTLIKRTRLFRTFVIQAVLALLLGYLFRR